MLSPALGSLRPWSDTARPTVLARRSFQACSDSSRSPVSQRPRTTVSVGALTRGGICVPPTVTCLPYRVSGSTLTAVGRSQLLARWPRTHSRILSGMQRSAQTVSGVYLKLSCSRVSASSALGVFNDYALYKSTHSLRLRVEGIVTLYVPLFTMEWMECDVVCGVQQTAGGVCEVAGGRENRKWLILTLLHYSI